MAATIAALLLALGPHAADAALHNPIPADASGDPTELLFDNQSLWAYMTSDIGGGRVCVVPDDGAVSSLSCDSPAPGMGRATTIGASIGLIFRLVKNAPLTPGTYRLLVEDSTHTPLEASQPFTVISCVSCDKEPDAAIVAAYKTAASDMADRMTGMCALQGILESVAGKAIGMRGIEKEIEVKATGSLTLSTPTFVLTLSGSVGFSFTVQDPATANIRKALDILKEVSCGAKLMYRDMAADPPDPNFTQVSLPAPLDIATLSPAALDSSVRSVDRERALVEATLRAFERYQGAKAAADAGWQVTQLRAAGEHASALSLELGRTAAALRSWSNDAAADPELLGTMLTASEAADLRDLYARVRTSGFNADEIAQFHALGYTDARIAVIRTHASADVDAIPVDTTYPTALRSVATALEGRADAVADFASSMYAAAGRIEATTPTNRAPVAANDSLSTQQGVVGSLNVLANDSDPDGDLLTVMGSTNGAHGLVSCAFNGICSFTPASGYNGTDSFTYTVSDGRGGTADGIVSVTVTSVPLPNRPPRAVDDVLGTAEATPGSVDVLLNDSDPDGDQLHVSGITAAGHGSVSCAPTGLCTYTPNAGFNGSDSFVYTASDGRGGTATATVAVTVGARANVAPIAVDDQVSTSEDASVSFNPLANDTDGDGDTLAITSITTPARGALTCAGSGACTYTPGANLHGTDHVDYTVSDGHGGTDVGTITITVAPVNDPPSLADDVLTAGTGTPTTINVLANDVDIDGDKLTLAGPTTPGHGTVSCASTGVCTYTAVAGYLGPDSFSYTATDGHGGSGTARVAVTVVAAPPVARIVATPTRGFAPLGVTFDGGTSTDVDGDIVSYEWTFGDGSTAAGRLVTHTYVTPATRTATLKVTDSGGRSSTASVSIFVQDVATLTLPICGDQAEGAVRLRCPDYELLREVQMYEVPGAGPVDVRFDWVLREAAFNNELAVYDADDALGSVGGLRPGEPGYLAAAFGRARVVFPSGSNASTPDRTLTFEGGDVLVLFIVQNNTLAQLLLRNPTNQPNLGPQSFFSLDALNPDGADHQFGYRSKLDQSIQFGFEDLAGGGGDFNDIVFNIYASLRAIPPLVVTKTADEPVSEPGHANGYTITVTNSGATAILESISDTLPEGFSYRSGTSTGATTTDPQVSGRTLRWSGPFTVRKGESVTLHFRINVAAEPGTYLNEATADAGGFEIAPTGPTAKVIVSGPSNQPPVALGATLTTNEETPVDLVLRASDPDGDGLAFAIVDQPQHGTLVGTPPTMRYTPAAGYAGPDAFTFKANDGTVDSSLAQVAITVVRVPRPTATEYGGGTSVQYSDPVSLSAVLRDTLYVPSVPVADRQVEFALGAQHAVGGPTGADGRASASLVVDQRPGSVTQVVTSFAGDARFLPSTDADAFRIEREDCILAYSGAIVVQPLAMTTLAAELGESDVSLGDRSARTITFTAVGVANPAPQVFSAVTGPGGQASTLAALAADVYAISVSFAGDDFYKPCSGQFEAVVTVEPASAKVTGGGWISIATGRTSFGFNAIPQAGGRWSGQLQLRGANGKTRFHSAVVSTLTPSGRSAAWSGTGAWNGVPGYSYMVGVVDNGSSGSKKGDTIAIVVRGPAGETVYTSGPAQTLKGGNITVH